MKPDIKDICKKCKIMPLFSLIYFGFVPGSLYVTQTGLKFLGSSNPPTPSSQISMTVGMNHHAQLNLKKFLNI
jgi:hypothetical protein